ncbi:MAG: methyltransferase domain-containing protein [Synergistaceae bacterium]|jgi:trans-aconitate methyltransferase|nr:methyltransferase domain-containing protein [Synergistaceae bacterium]
MTNQVWNPENYKKSANFVAALGMPVIELLDPKPGERVLDVGCGDGVLTKALVDRGCEVIGIDSSEEMVASARSLGLNVRVADAHKLEAEFAQAGKFDAVMSNAAIHWMGDQYAVVRGVWDVLRPGGRFAAECAGEGNVRIIREGMKISLINRGIDYKARNPWKYPDVGMFSNILENQGFRVSYIARIDRPTKLPNGLRGWLEVFSNSHTRDFSDDERIHFYEEVENYCRPKLYSDEKGWTADYVRLRFLALKPKE